MSEKNQENIEEIFDEANENEINDTTSEEAAENSEPIEEASENEGDSKIAELEKKLQEAEAKYVRLYADFDNYRRRVKLDAEAAQKYRAQSLVTNLLPALDNFDRAINSTKETEETKPILQGMNMVLSSILSAMKEEGVEVIESVGKEFDPHVHQAIMQDNNEEFGSNIVVEEFQKGYTYHDSVVRYSMVKVAN